MHSNLRRPFLVGVSGASGTPYAAAVLRGLLDAGASVDLVVSRAARLTLLDEYGVTWRDSQWRADLSVWLGRGLDGADLVHWSPGDLAAGPSSGSYPTRGMVVIPASTEAVASLALGLSKDLLQRAAAVTLKERRPLVVVPREMPLGRSTLVHLVALHDAGAVVAPASPAFYGGAFYGGAFYGGAAGAGAPASALIDFVAGRVLDALGVEHALYTRWRGDLGAGRG